MTILLSPQIVFPYNANPTIDARNAISMDNVASWGLKEVSANVDYLSNYNNIFNPTILITGNNSSYTSTPTDSLFASINVGSIYRYKHCLFQISHTSFRNAALSKIEVENNGITSTFTKPTFSIHQLVATPIMVHLYQSNRSTTSGRVSNFTISITLTDDGTHPNE